MRLDLHREHDTQCVLINYQKDVLIRSSGASSHCVCVQLMNNNFMFMNQNN